MRKLFMCSSLTAAVESRNKSQMINHFGLGYGTDGVMPSGIHLKTPFLLHKIQPHGPGQQAGQWLPFKSSRQWCFLGRAKR